MSTSMGLFRVEVEGSVSEAEGDELLNRNDAGVEWFVRNAAVGDEYKVGGGEAPVFALARLK